MKIKCRKCGIVFSGVDNMTFNDIKYYQSLQCGTDGTHALVGVN